MINYNHLNYKNRIIIQEYLNKGFSIRKIAKQINKSPSTISREIKRNFDNDKLIYNPEIANQKSILRSKHRSYFWYFLVRDRYEEFIDQFAALYDGKLWTVESTYFFIKNNMSVNKFEIPCLKTVFNWINSGKWVFSRKDLLRKNYTKGGKRSKTNVIDRLVGARFVKPIWARPKEINNRLEFGHWELDLVCGKNVRGANHIITLVERKTRFCYVAVMKGKHPDNLNRILNNLIANNNIPVKSITTDNGFEFRKIGLLAYKLNIFVYFTDKYASWQKGSNENWNGIFRRIFAKGTNFNEIDINEIQIATERINFKRRKIFNWKSSYALYEKELIEEYNKIFA